MTRKMPNLLDKATNTSTQKAKLCGWKLLLTELTSTPSAKGRYKSASVGHGVIRELLHLVATTTV